MVNTRRKFGEVWISGSGYTYGKFYNMFYFSLRRPVFRYIQDHRCPFGTHNAARAGEVRSSYSANFVNIGDGSTTVTLCFVNFPLIHYYSYNNHFCNEFTHQKDDGNRITVTESQNSASARWIMGFSDGSNSQLRHGMEWHKVGLRNVDCTRASTCNVQHRTDQRPAQIGLPGDHILVVCSRSSMFSWLPVFKKNSRMF